MEAKISDRDDLYRISAVGSEICKKLKEIYYKTKLWPECYQDVSNKITELKSIARKFYVDKDELDMLKELAKYSIEDIKEMYNCSM